MELSEECGGRKRRIPGLGDWAVSLLYLPVYGIGRSIAARIWGIQEGMGRNLIFDEKYRVVGLERDRLTLRGVHSGDVLTILNSEPEIPLTLEEYPLGKLIALTDPSLAATD
jgi:hypothetical protein